MKMDMMIFGKMRWISKAITVISLLLSAAFALFLWGILNPTTLILQLFVGIVLVFTTSLVFLGLKAGLTAFTFFAVMLFVQRRIRRSFKDLVKGFD